jgi:hypothetical protein
MSFSKRLINCLKFEAVNTSSELLIQIHYLIFILYLFYIYLANINAVKIKSNANTNNDDCTTVEVVAREMPSEVGTQS